ncbi:hypothetical protein HCA61_05515 [Rhodococcus sp. HNM0563]|uniref:hypothetical protein n=1 Tax=Rhodococcus sp. HNM0563 TaxID=2716339 RepID=UPI00146E3E61|nr:hypothetical protein [Rhodococcus sp. HNM0563]NLU61721.1 hypothetical protein [Rhodococcus sp. HNM0563]
MHWIVWLLIAWLTLSVVAALVFGRVIAARDRGEKPPPLEDDSSDETWRDAG